MALTRKLLTALWRFVTTGDVPQGVILRKGVIELRDMRVVKQFRRSSAPQ